MKFGWIYKLFGKLSKYRSTISSHWLSKIFFLLSELIETILKKIPKSPKLFASVCVCIYMAKIDTHLVYNNNNIPDIVKSLWKEKQSWMMEKSSYIKNCPWSNLCNTQEENKKRSTALHSDLYNLFTSSIMHSFFPNSIIQSHYMHINLPASQYTYISISVWRL